MCVYVVVLVRWSALSRSVDKNVNGNRKPTHPDVVAEFFFPGYLCPGDVPQNLFLRLNSLHFPGSQQCNKQLYYKVILCSIASQKYLINQQALVTKYLSVRNIVGKLCHCHSVVNKFLTFL